MKQWNNPIGRILLYNTLFPSKISRNSPQVSLKITKWFHNYKRWNSVLNCGHWLIHLLAKLNFITFPSCILYQSQCTWYDLNCRHIDVIDKILQVKCIVVLYFQLYILHFFLCDQVLFFPKQQNKQKTWIPNRDWLLRSTDDDSEETPNMQPQCELSGSIFSSSKKGCNKSKDICGALCF